MSPTLVPTPERQTRRSATAVEESDTVSSRECSVVHPIDPSALPQSSLTALPCASGKLLLSLAAMSGSHAAPS